MRSVTLAYEDQDGQLFEGSSATDIVRQMMSMKLSKPQSRAKYRKAVSRRVQEMTGLQIAFRSDKVFLASLVEARLLTVRH